MDELMRRLFEFVNHPIVSMTLFIAGIVGGASAAVTLRKEPASTRWRAVAGVSLTLVLLGIVAWLYPISPQRPSQLPPSQAQNQATGPSIETVLLFNEGQHLGQIREYGAALDVFRRVEALYPSFPLIHLNEGVMLKELGELPTAMRLMQDEDRLRPRDPNVEYNIACLLAITGHTDEAIQKLGSAGNDGFRRCDVLDNDSDWQGLRYRENFWRARHTICPAN
jgi:tetratricopeptide (TPR) repeat protein